MVRASRVNVLADFDDRLAFRDEGSGIVAASGPFGGVIRLDQIETSGTAFWAADSLRSGRLSLYVMIESRNTSGTVEVVASLADNGAMTDPAEIARFAVPVSFVGMIRVDLDLGSEGRTVANPLFAALSCIIAGGAEFAANARLGNRGA